MADKQIIFSAPMVRALLDGRKTQTRRVIKYGKYLPEFCGGRYDDKNDPSNYGWEDCERGEWITLDQWPRWNFVPYRKGDRLYVREAWRAMDGQDKFSGSQIAAQCLEAGYKRAWSPIQYEVDGERDNWIADPHGFGSKPGRYRHARFMPRWSSRLTLIVTDVRVQRLQEISEADALAEGVEPLHTGYFPYGITTFMTTCVDGREVPAQCCRTARHSFEMLWNSLHGPDAWGANPWVCAISFTVQRGNIDQMPGGDVMADKPNTSTEILRATQSCAEMHKRLRDEAVAKYAECAGQYAGAVDEVITLKADVARLRDALTLIERLYYLEGKDAKWRASHMNGAARDAQDGNDLGSYWRIFPRALQGASHDT